MAACSRAVKAQPTEYSQRKVGLWRPPAEAIQSISWWEKPAPSARKRIFCHRHQGSWATARVKMSMYFGREFEQQLAELGIRLLRPARKGEAERPGSRLFKPLRQVIESINETFKGQLDLERHRGRTPAGVAVRVLQRILALTAAIWHNDHTDQAVMRTLTAYDH
jgi:hypothetical protein